MCPCSSSCVGSLTFSLALYRTHTLVHTYTYTHVHNFSLSLSFPPLYKPHLVYIIRTRPTLLLSPALPPATVLFFLRAGAPYGGRRAEALKREARRRVESAGERKERKGKKGRTHETKNSPFSSFPFSFLPSSPSASAFASSL